MYCEDPRLSKAKWKVKIYATATMYNALWGHIIQDKKKSQNKLKATI